MMRFKNIIVFIFCLAIGFPLTGQKTFQPKSTDNDWVGIIYRKEMAYEGRLYTNGASIGINVGTIDTYLKTSYYHLSIGYLTDPREKRQNRNISFGFPERSRSFIFGKQNNIINLRGGFGRKRFISEKARRKGVAIGYDYQIGPSLALVKPYFLNLIFAVEGPNGNERELRAVRFTEENAELFTDFNNIFGGAGYFNGFGDISVTPGIQGYYGLFFSLGAFDEYVKSFEVGLMADIYVRKVPILIETEAVKNRPYFFNLYLKFIFGKRRN